VFISPLDWGMGHATRVIPVIEHLLEQQNTCVIGVTPSLKKLLMLQFPQLQFVDVPSYNIRYSSKRPVWSQLLSKAVNFFRVIKHEHQWLKEWVNINQPDVIISDNRYGMYAKGVTSWIICHQLQLKTPLLKGMANRIHRKLLKHFDLILVPDLPDVNLRLAGDLSCNRYGFHCKYISPLSRLKKVETSKKYDYLFLLSGAEPSQSEWLNEIMHVINQKTHLSFAVCTTSDYTGEIAGHIKLFKLPSSDVLSETIASSKTIVLRSGYSSLMDMYRMGKEDLILVPTMGQTEQEYLAKYWENNFNARVMSEKELGVVFD
jgi:hypothetical protein